MGYKNSWKNSSDVFQKQLELNKKQLSFNYLSNEYPIHWKSLYRLLLNGIERVQIKRVIDIGCGSGVCYELLKRDFPEMKYTGVDYSEHAVALAKATWGGDFRVMDFWDMKPEDIASYDMIHSDALLEVLSNGDKGLKHMLGLGAKNLLLNRIQNGQEANQARIYNAYESLSTYSYYHNREDLLNCFKEYGYSYMELASGNHYSTFFLWKAS